MTTTRWIEAQIEAMIKLDGDDQKIVPPEELPAPVKGCICPNQHQPDDRGFVISSPSCLLHGCRTRFVPMTRLTQNSARTVGTVHNRKGEN